MAGNWCRMIFFYNITIFRVFLQKYADLAEELLLSLSGR